MAVLHAEKLWRGLRARHLSKVLVLTGLAMAVGFAGAASARAAVLNVDTTTDDASLIGCEPATPNDCSLRGAIAKAGGLAEASTINVPAGRYVLTQSDARCVFHVDSVETETRSTTALCIDRGMTLVGAGATSTVIDGNQPSGVIGVGRPVMFVGHGATVEIRGLAMVNGNFSGNSSIGQGGGIRNFGTLTLTECVLEHNFSGAGNGGAVYNRGDLRVVRSVLAHNSTRGAGGAIANFGGLVRISESVISDNSAENGGGGIFNRSGTLAVTGMVTVVNSTISGNVSAGQGGALMNDSSNTMSLTNVTVSGNRARTAGGIFNAATMHLQNVTVTGNTAQFPTDPTRGVGGGILNSGPSLTVQNSLIAGNFAAGNCSINGCFPAGADCFAVNAALTSQGYNLIQSRDGCDIAGDTTGNIYEQAPKLELLADNGGPTRTHALLNDSPAIDAGSPAVSGSGASACAAVDQRGSPRPQGPRCDIGAYEASRGVPLLVLPNHGGNGGSVVAIIYGVEAPEGSTVKLSRAGQPDVPGDPVAVDGSSIIGTSFDLNGKTIGPWDVVVSRPGGATARIPGGFTVEDTRAPELWADILARTTVRVGRPATFTVIFGNRGNVDARAVPLVLSLPGTIGLTLGFQVVPPPSQPGQVAVDWTLVPTVSQIDGTTYVPLLLPVVPAGFTGTLDIRVTAPLASLGIPFTTRVQIGPSMFESGGIARQAENARRYADSVLGVPIPSTFVPQMEQYVTTVLESAVEQGRRTLVSGAGTAAVDVYSTAQLVIDAANFGVARAGASLVPSPGSIRVASAAELAASRTASSAGRLSAWVTSIAHGLRPLLFRASSTALRWVAMLVRPTEAYAASFGSCALRDMVYDPQLDRCAANGCQPNAKPECIGHGRPTTPDGSRDPNEKTGPTGAGQARNILGADTLTYVVFFENLESAGLAAQEVVITDQLDPATMDLDTVSLGAITFGDTLVSPPPGLSQYSGTVDLRPRRDLIVAINAGLDKATGLLAWRFVSLDPLTLQPPEDPLAGFLPPNVKPPEGDGSVLFTVKLKAGLTPGTQITNQARVVFDVNPPIDTPTWLNTIDSTHHLAITRITAPATVFLRAAPVTRRVTVQVQNRGAKPEVIADPAALAALVQLTVGSLGTCPARQPVLRPPARFPLTLLSRRTLGVVFDVTFDCANDSTRTTAKNPGHGDYQVSARLNLSALGHNDANPDDDVCPRSVPPPGVRDPDFFGTILDRGCGAPKADRTFGAPILIDVIRNP